MKLINWFKKTAAKFAAFVMNLGNETGEVITGAYEALDELGHKIVPIAVDVVQALKTFTASSSFDIATQIVAAAIPGIKDDAIIAAVKTWLKKELPKIAIQLQIVNSINNLMGPDAKVKAIINKLQGMDGRGADCLEFAAQLSLYLSDGKLSKSELKAAANDYYNKFVKA